jgi:exodeoxyribonuclease VII large subunit
MITAQRHRVVLMREQLSTLQLSLRALSPHSTLQRGYAVVSRRDTGAVVTRSGDVATGDGIEVRVSDGDFTAVVD